MWMANRPGRPPLEEGTAELGTVTLPGPQTGVLLAGERRNVTLSGPLGYHWTPARGDTVLIIRSGPEGTPCLAGKVREETEAPPPGEVWLSVAQGAGIRLTADGQIHLTGRVFLNGEEV